MKSRTERRGSPSHDPVTYDDCMPSDLWLDQEDPPDALPRVIAIANAMIDAEIEQVFTVHDALDVVWWVGPARTQPVVWPLRLHRHDNDCGRA